MQSIDTQTDAGAQRALRSPMPRCPPSFPELDPALENLAERTTMVELRQLSADLLERLAAAEREVRSRHTRCMELAMHIYITARHFDLTDTIRDHVQKHLIEAVQGHANPQEVTRLQVQLEVGQREAEFGCHVQLRLTGHRDINITEQSDDLYLAIDSAQKRLLTALSSHRETELKKVRHPRKFSAEKVAKILRGA